MTLKVHSIDVKTQPDRSLQPTSGLLRYLVLLAVNIGVLTSVHFLNADVSWRTENVLLVLFDSLLFAWLCPRWPALVLCVATEVVWCGTDLGREPDFWLGIVAHHVCRLTISVLMIVCVSRARRSFDDARHLARIDSLTGLPNRQAILDAIDAELGRVGRFGRSFSIAMLDCDGFKEINDRFGHQVGDRVLQTIGDALRKQTRSYDCIGRLGGDEFVLILSELNTDEIPMIIERLRAGLHLALKKEYPSLSFSIGVVTIEGSSGEPVKHLDRFDCLRQADEAMYSAKRSGRDQTKFVMIMNN